MSDDGGSSKADGEPKEQIDEKSGDLGKKRKLSPSDPINIPGSSQESPSHTSARVPSWVAGGSPARYVAVDELMKMQIAMDNMSVVHEIALDPNFKIEDIPKNPIEKAIRESMHKAYWDLLKEDLAKQPPVYKNAFNLLMEIKQTILDEMLLPHHVRLRSEVEMILDENTLRSQLEQGEIDVTKVGSFICEVLKRLCCQARVEDVEKLAKEENIVELIKGIFAQIDVMKNDMTNYVLSVNRNEIEAYSQELEYKQWEQYMVTVPDGDKLTRAWLRAAYDDVFGAPETPSDSEPNAKREKESDEDRFIKTTGRAYVKLVEVQKPDPFPETLRIDKLRLEALAEKFLQMVVCTSAVWVTCNLAGQELAETEGFKKTLKDHLILITNDIDESNASSQLESLAEQCVREVKEWSEKVGVQVENTSQRDSDIRQQIQNIAEESHAVRKLVHGRICQFIEQMLSPASDNVPYRLQPGLSVIQTELYGFMARLIRICVHNRRTFAQLYTEIVSSFEKDLHKNKDTESSTSNVAAES